MNYRHILEIKFFFSEFEGLKWTGKLLESFGREKGAQEKPSSANWQAIGKPNLTKKLAAADYKNDDYEIRVGQCLGTCNYSSALRIS